MLLSPRSLRRDLWQDALALFSLPSENAQRTNQGSAGPSIHPPYFLWHSVENISRWTQSFAELKNLFAHCIPSGHHMYNYSRKGQPGFPMPCCLSEKKLMPLFTASWPDCQNTQNLPNLAEVIIKIEADQICAYEYECNSPWHTRWRMKGGG